MRWAIAACLVWASLFGASLLAPASATAGTLTLNAVEDAYATEAASRVNTGGYSYLSASATDAERRVLLKFQVEGLPAGATNVRVTLRLWALGASTASFSVRSLPSEWSESTVTWANQPLAGDVLTTRSGVVGGAYTDFDVSGYVRGNGTRSMAIFSDAAARADFASREAGADRAPQLRLAWDDPRTVATFAAEDDAYVTAAAKDVVTGAYTYISTSAAVPERRALLRFDVTGVPAEAVNLKATLRLWAVDSSTAQISVSAVPSTWSEDAVTWNNQPALGVPITTRAGVVKGEYNDFDVSSYVTGNGTVSLAVLTASSSRVDFASEEGAPERQPQLRLNWTEDSAPSPPLDAPVLAAAGDIACAPGAPVTPTACQHYATSRLLLGPDVTAVQGLGDAQYLKGTRAEFLASYDLSWGLVKAKTHPAAGNHE